jgi:hypothetical protein
VHGLTIFLYWVNNAIEVTAQQITEYNGAQVTGFRADSEQRDTPWLKNVF